MKRTQKLRLLSANYVLTKFMPQPIDGRKSIKFLAGKGSMSGVITSHTQLRLHVLTGSCSVGEFVGGKNERLIWHDHCSMETLLCLGKNPVIILFHEDTILHIAGNEFGFSVDFCGQTYATQKPTDLVVG